jgi:hypothetical protein
VLPNDPSGDVMQLVLPATSAFGKEDNNRWPFRPYIQHLASHNVAASRVITKMAFDTKSPTPKVLFSPVAAVPEEDLEIIAQQAKSPAAELAIKMSVYQVDNAESVEAVEEVTQVDEPVKRASVATPAFTEKDTSDVIKKWSKKQG